MRVQWIGQSAVLPARQVENLRLLNGYAEIVESRQGKTVMALYGTPGLKRWQNVAGGGGIRMLFQSAATGRAFAVEGSELFELIQAGASSTPIGSLSTDHGPLSVEENSDGFLIVDGTARGYGFVYATNIFSTTTDPDFVGADKVAFLDQYMIFNKPGTQQFYWTDISSWNLGALNFASAEASPDLLLSLLVSHRELWLFGATTTEVWYDTGNLDNPFARIEGGLIQQGILAVHSCTRLGDSVVWLSANDRGQGMVLQATGYQPQRISTHAVERALASYSTLTDALAWEQQANGHVFLWMVFPTAGHTWVFDATAGLWHERGYLDPTTGTIGRHRANCGRQIFGQAMVGDWQDGRIYILDEQTYTDDGAVLQMEAVLPPFFDTDALHRVRQHSVQIDAQMGVGLDGGQQPGNDPHVALLFSNDGGMTFGNEHWATLGPIGTYRARARWSRLGVARDRRIKIRITDAVQRTIIGAITDIDVLGS